jgi:hypothetical protein
MSSPSLSPYDEYPQYQLDDIQQQNSPIVTLAPLLDTSAPSPVATIKPATHTSSSMSGVEITIIAIAIAIAVILLLVLVAASRKRMMMT